MFAHTTAKANTPAIDVVALTKPETLAGYRKMYDTGTFIQANGWATLTLLDEDKELAEFWHSKGMAKYPMARLILDSCENSKKRQRHYTNYSTGKLYSQARISELIKQHLGD